MDYFIMTDLVGIIPGKFVIEALDDNEDGAADTDVFTQLQTDAKSRVHAALGPRYSTPFSNPLPDIVVESAKVFAAEQCYTRRGKDAPAALTARVKDLESRLQKIGAGEMPLDPDIDRDQASASAITEDSKLGSKLSV